MFFLVHFSFNYLYCDFVIINKSCREQCLFKIWSRAVQPRLIPTRAKAGEKALALLLLFFYSFAKNDIPFNC